MVMLSMCIVKDIAVVFPVNNAIDQWQNDVQNLFYEKDTKGDRVISPHIKFVPDVEALLLYYDEDIAINKGHNILANQK